MAKIELINYTDRIGNPLYYVRIDGRQVAESETTDYAQAIRFYNYAVNNKGEESYEVVRHSVEQEDTHHEDLARAGWNFDEDFEYNESDIEKELEKLEKESDSLKHVSSEETESKLWNEWKDRPIWEATQSFQDYVNSKIEKEKEEAEKANKKEFTYVDTSFGAMANRMNNGEFLNFVSDCYKAKQKNKLNEFLSEFVNQFYFLDKKAIKASTHALYKAVLNSEPPF